MKKNKKSSGNVIEASSAVDIAPEALASLADKLKSDLANPNPPKQSPRKHSQEKKPGQGRQADDGQNKKKTIKASSKKTKAKSEKPAKGPIIHATRDSFVGTNGVSKPLAQSTEKPAFQNAKQVNKSDANKSKVPPEMSVTAKDAPLKEGKGPKRSGPAEKSKASSLLEDILALGGTKEDLELVDEIDSEEDIVGESQASKGKKSRQKNDDQTLQQELREQLKSLGLAGKFTEDIEDGSEGTETELEEDWTDEDSESPPSAKPDSKPTIQKNASLQSQTIDRPVQLSTSAKSEPKATGLQKHGKLKLEPQSLWYAIERPPITSAASAPNPEVISHLHARGKFLLQAESDNYMSSNYITSSDRQFLSTIMTSGTQSDKLSALTLSVSSSPLHCQKQLEALLNMARKKSRNEAVQAIAALKDLLVGNLLPDRKLFFFSKQPGIASNVTDADLILYTFEDWLKGWYFQVLQVIEELSMDPLPFVRNHMISYIFELLRDKPEQEQLLLRLLVNKLGDGSKKIAAKASYFLLQLESVHPQMKSIILHEIENLLFRPNTSIHAQYYAIITMNQTILTSRDTAVANRLVEVYFMLFVKLLRGGAKEATQPQKPKKAKGKGKKRRGAVDWGELNQQEEEVNSKTLSAVLTGVNRAFPFSKVENDVYILRKKKADDRFEKHMDILFMITHDANFNTAVQALILIYQVASAKQIVLDRYYRTLYESLLDPRLTKSSKQALYLNLLFKSLKSDTNISRVKAFVKRIIHITSMHSPGFTCGVLYLLHELSNSCPDIQSLWSAKSVTSHDDLPAVTYDARKRDPLYANADTTSLWELDSLLHHYHPTVQLYAQNLLETQPNATKPDLALHTVKHFLDRFVYRNPKVKPATKGSSIMQPLPGTDTGLVLRVRGHAKMERAVNSEEWWRQQIGRIKPEEVFFHRYFVAKEEREVKALGKKRKHGNEGDEELDEDEIWEALIKSSKVEGGLGDVDVDDDDDEGMEWSDDDLMDEEMAEEMNAEISELDDASDEETEEVVGKVGDKGDINAFFDDEAEIVENEDEDEDEDVETEEVPDAEYSGSEDSDGSANVDEPFEFGDSLSDLVDSDEDVAIPAQQTNSDRSKKRKLKNLPTFASAEEYAHMLED